MDFIRGYIWMEFLAGTSIEQAGAEAEQLACRIGVNVRFKFNDIECVAYTATAPMGQCWRIASEYREQLQELKP